MTTLAVARRRAPSGRSVRAGVITLAVLSVVGAGISVAGGLSPGWAHAMGPTGRLSIPWPMMLFQLALAVAAGSSRRVVALAGSGGIALALALGVVSGFFDGGYADARMTSVERGYQALFVVALVAVAAIAARRFRQLLARP